MSLFIFFSIKCASVVTPDKISELTTLVNAFSKRENKKERVALYSKVWFNDSSRAKLVRTQTISQKRSTIKVQSL